MSKTSVEGKKDRLLRLGREQEVRLKEELSSQENRSYVRAAAYANAALRYYTAAGDSKKIKELKAKALKYRQLSASELTQTLPPISADIQKVVNDEICLVIKKCTSFDTLSECLDYLARLSRLVPNYGEIAKHASEHLPLTSIIANHTVIDSEGHLISDDDEENYWTYHHYDLEMQVYIYEIAGVFQKLRLEKDLNNVTMMDYVLSKGILGSEECVKLQSAFVNHFIVGDNIAAVHILSPTIEGLIISLSRRLGIDVVAQDRGRITSRDISLGTNNITSESFTNVWGENFCRMIDYLLYNNFGPKLRHRTAHGSISIKECNDTSVVILLYILIKILNLVRITKKSTSEPQDDK